jgi:uncharacterized membrane protein
MHPSTRLLPCVALAIAAHLTCHHEVSAFSPPTRLPSSSFKGVVSTAKRAHSSYSTVVLHAAAAAPNDIVPSLISASNNWGNVAALSFTASLSQLLGKKTLVGKLLGAPVTAMAIAFILSSVGIIPSTTSFSASTSSSSSTEWMTILPPGGSHASTFLQGTSLTLATPLLLLGTSLRGKALQQCGSLLGSFSIASAGTLAGAMIAFSIKAIPRALLTCVPNQDGFKIAAALLAKNIGGGINYMAVCACLNASPESVAAGLCVDNVMALVYFPLVSLLASKYKDVDDNDGSIERGDVNIDEEEQEEAMSAKNTNELSPIESLSHAFTLAAVLTAGGQFMNSKLHHLAANPTLNLSLPLTTLMTVIFSTFYPPNKFLSPTSSSPSKNNIDNTKSNSIARAGETLGTSLLYLFFATAGAPGWRLKESIQQSFPSIASFLIIMYGMHGATLWLVKKFVEVTKIQYWKKVIAPQRLLTASSAAIGGPATAAALAQSHQWDSLLTPSLLVGNVGYAVATFIGLLFYGAASKSLMI